MLFQLLAPRTGSKRLLWLRRAGIAREVSALCLAGIPIQEVVEEEVPAMVPILRVAISFVRRILTKITGRLPRFRVISRAFGTSPERLGKSMTSQAM